MRVGKAALIALLLTSTSPASFADDWIAERLRGGVMHLHNGQWVTLERGDVVPDGRKVRTGDDGRLELVRGQERIALSSNTEISIRDAAGEKMTSVVQTTGTVSIEAERRNVQHFSVQTPVLAAVVKGTQFTVTYSNGQARVEVDSGVVQVQDNVHDMVVDVVRGQAAEAGRSAPLDVSGPGAERLVFLIDGEVVPAAARDAVVSGVLPAEEALEATRQRAVPGNNAGGNGNGHGRNGVTADVPGPIDRPGNNGNGNAFGHANGNSGNNGNAFGHANGNGGNGNSNNGNSHSKGNGTAGASAGNGNGLALGLGNGNGNGRSSSNGNANGNGNGNGNGSGKGNGRGN